MVFFKSKFIPSFQPGTYRRNRFIMLLLILIITYYMRLNTVPYTPYNLEMILKKVEMLMLSINLWHERVTVVQIRAP